MPRGDVGLSDRWWGPARRCDVVLAVEHSSSWTKGETPREGASDSTMNCRLWRRAVEVKEQYERMDYCQGLLPGRCVVWRREKIGGN
jgi:hypothetical protein